MCKKKRIWLVEYVYLSAIKMAKHWTLVAVWSTREVWGKGIIDPEVGYLYGHCTWAVGAPHDLSLTLQQPMYDLSPTYVMCDTLPSHHHLWCDDAFLGLPDLTLPQKIYGRHRHILLINNDHIKVWALFVFGMRICRATKGVIQLHTFRVLINYARNAVNASR